MFRVVTVGREYGSGGGPIAAQLATRLGWQLVDNSLITEIARSANVDPKICHQYDERLDSWLHRLSKQTFGLGAFEGVATGEQFDGEAMAAFSRQVIERAAEMGNVVIVGRGGQCVLQGRADVFHVFVYAPMDERIRRVREAYGSGFALPTYLSDQDKMRSAYIRHHFDQDWRDPHLYHALFCSKLGDETVVRMIAHALGREEEQPRNAR
ncbi:MAG TPA: cytidylate kinase-like family protein [Bryobacteraceae bacterium]|nr:cytidylate kinase-like family protein [Bryobacteraceae bacterium]